MTEKVIQCICIAAAATHKRQHPINVAAMLVAAAHGASDSAVIYMTQCQGPYSAFFNPRVTLVSHSISGVSKSYPSNSRHVDCRPS